MLWRTARPRSGSDGVVVLVRRGPLAERLLARGLPAEAGSALRKGLVTAMRTERLSKRIPNRSVLFTRSKSGPI